MRDGKEGVPGISPRLSVWKAGKTYHNDTELQTYSNRYLDYVTDTDFALEGTDEYHLYRCKVTHVSDATSNTLSNTALWEEVPGEPVIGPLILAQRIQADMIDVGALAADSAFVDELTVKKLDTRPTASGQKIRVKGNELQVLDGSGLPMVRVYGGDLSGNVGFGEEFLSDETYVTFEGGALNLEIPANSSGYAANGTYTFDFNDGAVLPAGTVISKQSLFELTFKVRVPRYATSGGYPYGVYACKTSHGVYLKYLMLVWSAKLVTGSGTVLASFSNDNSTWGQEELASSTADPLDAQRTVSLSTFSSYTLPNDDSIRVEVSWTLMGQLDGSTTQADNIYIDGDMSVYMGTLRIQEPSLTEITDGDLFLRFADGSGYGMIAHGDRDVISGGGVVFRHKGSSSSKAYCMGLDSGGMFVMTGAGTTKKYVTVDSNGYLKAE